MLSLRHNDKNLDLNSVFEAVGAYKAGKMTEKEVWEYEEKACPGCGSCSGMFTANSMNCLTEVWEWVFRATERSLRFMRKEYALQRKPE